MILGMGLHSDSLPSQKRRFMIVLVTTTILVLSISFTAPNVLEQGSSFTATIKARLDYYIGVTGTHQGECPSVLTHMLKGHWKTRPLNRKENEDITAFLTNAHARFRFPANYQRNDSLCGNVTHVGSQMATKFRALCDPRGATPCCYHNQCAMKSVEECVCEDCYDMRHMKHAEYSTWIPSHPTCPYKQHSPKEACDVLNGTAITFVGDSLVRHVYTAMLLIVTGDMKNGAIQRNIDNESKVLCEEMYMFTEKKCRLLLNERILACNGALRLSLYRYATHDSGPRLKDLAVLSKEKSIIFASIGVHSGFVYNAVQTKYLLPSLTYMKTHNRTWPRFFWAAHHAPGILKSPKFLNQSYDIVEKYNAKMEPFLNSWKIPIFDTFNLTDGMMSFDGEHYGRGMNVVKANILLSYIREMRESQSW